MRITIIPGPDAQGDEEILDHLLGFERTLSTEEFDSESLRTIFDEVQLSMKHTGGDPFDIR